MKSCKEEKSTSAGSAGGEVATVAVVLHLQGGFPYWNVCSSRVKRLIFFEQQNGERGKQDACKIRDATDALLEL